MTPHVQAVMARYRELGSNLEASRTVLREAQEGTLGVTQHGVTHDENVKLCNGCYKEFSGRGGTCNACRQRAYRERSK